MEINVEGHAGLDARLLFELLEVGVLGVLVNHFADDVAVLADFEKDVHSAIGSGFGADGKDLAEHVRAGQAGDVFLDDGVGIALAGLGVDVLHDLVGRDGAIADDEDVGDARPAVGRLGVRRRRGPAKCRRRQHANQQFAPTRHSHLVRPVRRGHEASSECRYRLAFSRERAE